MKISGFGPIQFQQVSFYQCSWFNNKISMKKQQSQCQKRTTAKSQPQIKTYLPNLNQNLIDKFIFSQSQILMIHDDSYIIIHHKGQIYMIDQHAACEKILYMENYQQAKRTREAREVKEKTIYQIPNLYKAVLVDNQKDVNLLGWYFKIASGKGAVFEIQILKEPYILNAILGQQELVYYLEQIYDNEDKSWAQIKFKTDLSPREKEIIAEYACHKSFRFGQKMSLQKAQEIVRKLSTIQAPFNCPHSRVLISYYGNAKELGLDF